MFSAIGESILYLFANMSDAILSFLYRVLFFFFGVPN
jgi:hypothetical protein